MPNEKTQFGCAPCTSFPPVMSLSAGEVIEDAEKQQPTLFKTLAPVDLARWLVGLQIKAHPEVMGPPISLLTVTAGGAQFKERGLCSW